MKNFSIPLLILVVLLTTVGVLSFNRGKDKGYSGAAIEYLWQLDTLQAICSKIPDTVRTSDTIINEKIVYIDRYKPIETTEGEYLDTIKTNDLDFWIHDKVTGSIDSRKTGYKLKVPKIIRDSITIHKEIPHFIDVIKIEKIEYKGFLSASVGFRYYGVSYSKIINDRFALGLGGCIINNDVYATINASYLFKK